ncbi:D-xylose ABC transporter ATP-binding protein [Bacillus canaveralius]|uniref:D-xylose ABC transporter ATP-binding protein n=1 Tax=Bacillus canaveralius TaxID=1403243 RepID=A0A2N5GGF1_9BACI|nr:sugar ABC transporter ATP-binding protein [Bacillus canaveralius]PLR79811.1 D-xylose ABC transporter ATP-binding protein [Bacillus canaveralius]PLR93662.1 D-xylose ABC transporter ATP-binding protein [Bacillus canaveralius]RSK47438.1 sugar ABC transporter ATP-binding protein [Bacillus canaveralius]
MKKLLTMENISKSFSGVKVLNNARLDINEGEVHALMGANGAGKSTLMKILTGVYQKDQGIIRLDNGKGALEGIEFQFPLQALEKGISMVYQEFNLVANLSIAENIFLGREPINKLTKMIDWNKMFNDSKSALQQVGIKLDPKMKVEELSTAQKQTVEIAKCLSLNSRIIIMDEPTASLTDREISILFDIINDLKNKGYSIVYISHRMEEIFSITDRITVMKDGRFVETLETRNTDNSELVRLMVGKEIIAPRKSKSVYGMNNKPVLSARNIHTKKLLKNINFELNKGEILGFFGLVGAGRTELARVIFGIDKLDKGEIHLEGKKVYIRTPFEATEHHIGLVPEDRKDLGLILDLPIKNNIILTKLRHLNPFILNNQTQNQLSNKYIEQLSIATTGPEQKAAELSGGNQQKVVIAKWLSVSPKILILDEPTRGIDIGAKTEIYQLMRDLVDDGMSIIMISSELPEILDVSDRVIVMHEGKITMDQINEHLDQETILHYAMGVGK